MAPWQEVGQVELCLADTRLGPAPGPAGLCVPEPSAAGEACRTAAECRSRESCVCGRCTVARCLLPEDCDDDAGEGTWICRDAHCLRACTEAADCDAAEICSAGACRRGCVGDGAAECQAGEVCATEGIERRCTAVACASGAECLATETCRIQREPRQVDEPSALAGQTGDGITLWVEIDGAVWRAASTDGRHFHLDPEEPVLPAALAPSVVRTSAGYELWVETAEGLAVASSTDGRLFGPLETRQTGALHAPAAVVLADGSVAVWAESGGELVRAGGATALTPAQVADPLFWRELSALGSPHALLEEGVLRLWFAGIGVESATAEELGVSTEPPPNPSIGYAAAFPADAVLQPWLFNPVFQRTASLLTKLDERAPAVVHLPGRDAYLLYFVGNDGLRLARNPPALP